MYTIGQFSLITRLSVRTLRKYHESGLLIPDHIDEESGYRYYKESAIERAQVITGLRELDFPLKEIQQILGRCKEDEDILDFLMEQKRTIDQELQRIRNIEAGLEDTIQRVKQRQRIPEGSEEIQLKNIPEILIVGLRRTGPWSEIGTSFKLLGRKAGRHIAGPAMSFCFDGEYREEANYEAAFPVKREVNIKGSGANEPECHRIEPARCVSLLYKGPYDRIGAGYERAMSFIQERGLSWQTPTREIYHRGPGIIFRGNPEKYITEIQIPLQESLH